MLLAHVLIGRCLTSRQRLSAFRKTGILQGQSSCFRNSTMSEKPGQWEIENYTTSTYSLSCLGPLPRGTENTVVYA